jgi:TonB family protein
MRRRLFFFFFVLTTSFAWSQELIEPGPVGGMREWKHIVHYQMQYPYASIQANEKGTVSIDCFISSAGELTEIEFIKSVSEALDRETVRLLNLVVWDPATYGSSRMSGKVRMHIDYYPERYRKYCQERGYRKLPQPVRPVTDSRKILASHQVDSLAKPLIPEGWEAFPYILTLVKYPEDAVRNNVQGEVRLRYVVERSGDITNIQTIHNLAGGCPQEVVRVLRSLRWIPAIKNGEAVRSTQEISIQFRLSNAGTQTQFINGGREGIY